MSLFFSIMHTHSPWAFAMCLHPGLSSIQLLTHLYPSLLHLSVKSTAQIFHLQLHVQDKGWCVVLSFLCCCCCCALVVCEVPSCGILLVGSCSEFIAVITIVWLTRFYSQRLAFGRSGLGFLTEGCVH